MNLQPEARIFTICNRRGLHARSSAKFVKCVAEFDANVRVRRDGQEVSGASIMGLLMLGAAQHCDIEVSAEGPQAVAALDALQALVGSGFGEEN
ncbi:MAG: HPr family phosphocarrier protein [Alphaproteobacteria bacterium]|nr:HPr family phosphocarrier protein [Alphaproteobacteria bacterium]